MAPREPAVLILPVTHDVLNNNHKTVFGGWIMAQMDIAACIPAYKRAKCAVVTKLVKEINFLNSGQADDLFYFYAQVANVGQTSLTIDVQVIAQRDVLNPKEIPIATGQMIFVAIDEHAKPKKIQ